ncbi:transposase [Planomonospora sphaerica]|uniref:Mutator family transposase n=1 Tax=Planomonospora sphaerica TaxID=161355 RepID=A0A171DJU0_9ACTN|nr:transposase [Planomonospora sphaerica]
MAVNNSVDPMAWLAEQIQTSDPDLLRSMVKTMAEAPVSAEADAPCGAAYGERSSERANRRNGYRPRGWDTRAGTVELAIPKLRSGTYFPVGWRTTLALSSCSHSVRIRALPAAVQRRAVSRSRTSEREPRASDFHAPTKDGPFLPSIHSFVVL